MARKPRKTKLKSSKPKSSRRQAASGKASLAAATTPKSQHTRKLGRWELIAAYSSLAVVLAIGLITTTHSLQTAHHTVTQTTANATTNESRLHQLSEQVGSLETAEEITHIQIVSDTALEQQLSQIQHEITRGRYGQVTVTINKFAGQVTAYQTKLAGQVAPTATTLPSNPTLTVPILVYHKTPDNFDAQLDVLEQKNYHTITMAQLTAALHNLGSLPPKPVVITFDDGFADQMQAFSLLQQHHMVATFYIIDGGAESRWCIGAGRRYNDPLQPPTGCGDAYLSWNQVRQLDRSGIITIGSHTIDHPDLATESSQQQQYEIIQGKQELEAQLGHPVYDFAYPYGSYNATTLAIVKQAGFATAVTTTAGISQSLAGIYTLDRVRDPNALP
jgi:peptidoglycan/xylan/chitin deacetylase (PgdA/CDA1 family)